MFDWVWIHLWRVFVLEIPRKLTSGKCFCKVAGSKTLISMQQDSTREKIWRRTLLQKSAFKVTEKEKTLMNVFINLQLPENGRLLWPFPGNYHKISAENRCHCRQIRSEQISTCVIFLKHCIITCDISRWNDVSLKKYIEMKLHGKETANDSYF